MSQTDSRQRTLNVRRASGSLLTRPLSAGEPGVGTPWEEAFCHARTLKAPGV